MASWTGGKKKYNNPLDSAKRSGRPTTTSSSPGGGNVSPNTSTASTPGSSRPPSPGASTPGIINAINRGNPNTQTTRENPFVNAGPRYAAKQAAQKNTLPQTRGASYASSSPSSRSLPAPEQPGITRTINTGLEARKPQGGASFFREQPPKQEDNYTPAYGYNTPEGEVRYQYQVRDNRPSPQERDKKAIKYFWPNIESGGQLGEGGTDRAYKALPKRLRTDDRRKLYDLPKPKTPTGEVIYGVANLPNKAFASPLPTAEEQSRNIAVGTVVGGAAGAGTGAVVRGTAARYGVSTAAKAERWVNYGGAGLTGAGVIADPRGAGENIPALVFGGVAASKGYRSVVPENNAAFGGVSGTSGELRTTRTTVSGFGTGKTKATITEFGNTRTEDVPIAYTISGAKTQSGRYQVDIQTVGAVNVAGKNTFVTQDFSGNINPSTNVLSATNRQGDYFFSSIGKQNPSGVSNTRFAILRENKWNIPVVQSTGKGLQVSDRTSYQQFSPRSYKAENVELFSLGKPSSFTFEQSAGVSAGRPNSGTTKKLFSGFNDLSQSGYYNQRVTQPWRTPSLGRRGTIGRPSQATETIVDPLRTGKLRGGRSPRVSIEGLPQGRVVVPSRVPFYALNPGTATNNAVGFNRDTRFFQTKAPRITEENVVRKPSTTNRIIPATSSAITPRQDIAPVNILRPGTQTLPYNRTTTPPDLPVPFLPLVGFGIPPSRTAIDRGGKGRGFRYEADLTSSLLGIKGKKKKGLLSGLELRPVSR